MSVTLSQGNQGPWAWQDILHMCTHSSERLPLPHRNYLLNERQLEKSLFASTHSWVYQKEIAVPRSSQLTLEPNVPSTVITSLIPLLCACWHDIWVGVDVYMLSSWNHEHLRNDVIATALFPSDRSALLYISLKRFFKRRFRLEDNWSAPVHIS